MDSMLRVLHGQVSSMLSVMAQAKQRGAIPDDEARKDFDRIRGHLDSLQEDIEIMLAVYKPQKDELDLPDEW